MKSLILVITFLLCNTLCHGQADLAKYQKRSKGFVPLVNADDIREYITVDLINVTKPQPIPTSNPANEQKRNVFNLGEKGQKALIETLGKMSKDNDKIFLENLSKEIGVSSDQASPLEIKNNDFMSRFDIKIDNRTGLKENRIDELEIFIRLDDVDEIEFIGFNNFSSRYKTIDFGTLSVSKVTGFTANAGINIAGTGSISSASTNGVQVTNTSGTDDYNSSASQNANNISNTNGITTSNASNVGATFSYNNTKSQQIAIKSDVVVMKGVLTSNEFSIFQKGAPNQDLNDNVNINVLCKSKRNVTESYFIIKGLFDEKTTEANTDDTKIKIKPGYISCPKITKDITVSVNYSFIFRNVIRGGNTVKESDDVINSPYVDNRTITQSKKTIFNKDDLKTKLISVQNSYNATMYIDYYDKKVPLYFLNEISALTFIEWLKQTSFVKLKKFNLYFSKEGKVFEKYNFTTALDLKVKEVFM